MADIISSINSATGSSYTAPKLPAVDPALTGSINAATGYTPNMGTDGGAMYTQPAAGGGTSFASLPLSTAPYNPYTDPKYAQYGGYDAYNKLVNGYGTQKNNIFGTAADAAVQAGAGLKSSILDLVDSLKSGQSKIDQEGVNSELKKIQGGRSILDMVGRGIRSGGVMLNNKNASSSSATDAIARAYGEIGKGQATGVGNEYALDQNNIGLEQDQLGASRATGMRHIGESKDNMVASIVSDARNKLAALDAAMSNDALPGLDIDSAKEQVRQDALAKLSDIDGYLNSQIGGVNPMGQDNRVSEAHRLADAGQAATGLFNLNTPTAQFQGTGAAPSDLPIFTFGRKNIA